MQKERDIKCKSRSVNSTLKEADLRPTQHAEEGIIWRALQPAKETLENKLRDWHNKLKKGDNAANREKITTCFKRCLHNVHSMLKMWGNCAGFQRELLNRTSVVRLLHANSSM
jgi:hypothetical protein